MRILKTKNQKVMFYIFWFVLGICLYIPAKLYINDETKTIFKNGEFTVGELTFFSVSKGGIGVPGTISSPPKPAQIGYIYNYNGNNYKSQYDEGVFEMPSSALEKGEKFLVIFLKKDPTKSRMLFNYPIKDSTDFEKYMNEFKTNPPKP